MCTWNGNKKCTLGNGLEDVNAVELIKMWAGCRSEDSDKPPFSGEHSVHPLLKPISECCTRK